jgi:isoleucyl-tRNA synthetase
VIRTVRDAYTAYEFHTVYHTLYNFCTVTLSARYFDILKDRLYTYAPRSLARRSAQTALYRIADALARMLGPLLVFTADEIWENLPPDQARPASVHMSLLPDENGQGEEGLLENWERLYEIRDDVLQSLEEARVAKQIGSSLEARLQISASGDSYDLLVRYRDELRYIFIVSQVDVVRSDEGATGVVVRVLPAEGKKCERCWNYSTHVGESTRYPDVCERCVAALEEIERETA